MIIPPFITDNGPSWEEGMVNDILPYQIDVNFGEYLLIHPSGKEVPCGWENFRQYLRMAVQGTIHARVGYDDDLNLHLTVKDIQPKPTGQVGDWFMTPEGTLAQYQGEMFFYDLITGKKWNGPGYARNGCWVVEEALHPIAGNVIRDYTQQDIFVASAISAREEILSITLMKNGQPFNGRMAGWHDCGFFITTWENGRILKTHKEEENLVDYDVEDFIVMVKTPTQTFTEQIELMVIVD